MVTREGMPLGYELFAGNRADVTTVKEIVETMERRYGMASRIWVMDRGMASADNLKWLEGQRAALPDRHVRGRGCKQLVQELPPPHGLAVSGRGEWTVKLVRRERWAKTITCCAAPPNAGPRSRPCISASRSGSSRASNALADRIAALTKRPLEPQRAWTDRSDGLLGANGHAAGRYQIDLEDDPTCAAGLKLKVSINAALGSSAPRWPRAAMCCAPI